MPEGAARHPNAPLAQLAPRRIVSSLPRTGGKWLKAASSPSLAPQLLLEAGASPNVRDARGDAPLSLAAAHGHAAAVGALLQAGAETDPVSMGELGMITPLGAAACGDSSEHASCVSLLLAAGAVLNPPSELGLAPPLWCAASAGAARCVAVLLAHGAHVEAGHMGRTPLMAAAAAGCPGSVWLLLEAGAALEAAGSDGGQGWAGAAFMW